MRRKSLREIYGDPDAILTGDWHITEHVPSARVDDFLSAVIRKLKYVRKLQKVFGCPVLNSGDVFDYWKVNPFTISLALAYFPDEMVGVYGNHDLPRHAFGLREYSALYTLESAGRFKVVGLSYGLDFDVYEGEKYLEIRGRKILITHRFVYQKREHWYGKNTSHARGLLRKYPEFDLILTGDNHQSFTEQYKGRLLVNPGCLVRKTLAEKDYEPSVYLWYADDNRVVRLSVPYGKDVFQSATKVHNEREKAFIDRVSKLTGSVVVNFKQNLIEYFRQKKIIKSVEQIVFKSIESSKGVKYNE